MTETREEQEKRLDSDARKAEEVYAECNQIDDPVRRGLCKVCGTPVAGALPFCQQHEPPVP